MRMTHRLTAMLISAAVVFSVAPAATADAAAHRPATQAVATQSASPTLTVDPDDHTGDARVTVGYGLYLNAYGWEWNVLGTALVAAGGVVATAGCVIKNVPGAWGAALKLICGTIGATNLNNLARWIRDAYRSIGFQAGRCYQTKIVPMNQKWKIVRAKGNCYS